MLLPSPCQGNQGGQQPTAQRMAGPADCSELAIAGEQDGGTVVMVIVAHQRHVKPWCSLRCHVTGFGGVCMGSLPCRLVARRLMQIANRTFSSSLGQPTSHRDDAAQTLYVIFNRAAVQVRHIHSPCPPARPQSPKRCVAQAALSRSCCSTTPVAAMVPRAITP